VEVQAELVDLSDRKPWRSGSMSKQLTVTSLDGTMLLDSGADHRRTWVRLDIAETISVRGPKAEAMHIRYY
jgi:hypothetical protein